MGGKPTKNFFEEKLASLFKFAVPSAEIVGDKVIAITFISPSSLSLAKKQEKYGILVDGKKWCSKDVYISILTEHGEFVFPITELDEPILTSKVSKEEKIDAECSLVFNIVYRGKTYPCVLQDKVFRHNIILKPKYETVINITEAAKV